MSKTISKKVDIPAEFEAIANDTGVSVKALAERALREGAPATVRAAYGFSGLPVPEEYTSNGSGPPTPPETARQR